jgi:hypothetical protein
MSKYLILIILVCHGLRAYLVMSRKYFWILIFLIFLKNKMCFLLKKLGNQKVDYEKFVVSINSLIEDLFETYLRKSI